MLADEEGQEGDWLVALRQSDGRGRQGRGWSMTKGNFAGSTLVVVRPADPEPQTLSLVAGLAAIEAVEAAAPGLPLCLKWPNDLLFDGGKLAGILLERSGQRIAVGIGVNLAVAPDIAGRETASIAGAVDPKAFAPLLAGTFARWLERWRNSAPGQIADAWLERAHPIGTKLKVHTDAANFVSGRFEGLAPDGALLLRSAEGAIETIRAGDVSLS